MGQHSVASAEGATWRLELSVPPELNALQDVRRSFDAFGLPADVRDDARLLVTELVSNSIRQDRKSTRLNYSHTVISYAVFCLKKKKHTLSKHTRLSNAK